MEHHKHSPSSFPMKNRCPLYEAGPAGDAANRGTAMHDSLAQMLGAEPTLDLFELSEGDKSEVEWAYSYIRDNASETWPLEVEVKLSYHDPSMRKLYFGTGDVVNGPNIYDLKTGEQHAYWHQMAGYALALMSEKGYSVVNINLLFSRYKKVQQYTITREQAEPAILGIITQAEDPNATPRPNEFCGWCKKNIVCPAVKERVSAIVTYNDWKLDTYNPNEIAKNPNELSKAIVLSRLMKKWVSAIDDVSKEHDDIPGFQWKEVSGRKVVAKMSDLFLALNSDLDHIHLDKFLDKCSISLTNLAEFISDAKGMTMKEAKDYIDKKFSDYITQNKPYRKLEEQNK
jgi:hypothetical protein